MKQLEFAWHIFIAGLSAAATGLIYADRANGGPNDEWWLPFITIGFFAGSLSAAVATAKKDWK
ncbi:membrane protein [Arthrobacter phage BruhMoment]|nr:membrane protein [Arthrobacter phage BruhMoment]